MKSHEESTLSSISTGLVMASSSLCISQQCLGEAVICGMHHHNKNLWILVIHSRRMYTAGCKLDLEISRFFFFVMFFLNEFLWRIEKMHSAWERLRYEGICHDHLAIAKARRAKTTHHVYLSHDMGSRAPQFGIINGFVSTVCYLGVHFPCDG